MAEVVAEGVPFGEGPVWCDDGTLVCTAMAEGWLYRIRPDQRRAERTVDTGGGPNGAAPAAGGGLVVTQNGGVDLAAFFPGTEVRPRSPGLQLVDPGGAVTDACTGPFRAPNDLACAPDGTLWFTDPPHHPPPAEPVGRVWRWAPGAEPEVAASGLHYPNGIGIEPDGTVLIVERRGLLRLLPDGGRRWLVEEVGPGGTDGFAVDAEGFVYACGLRDHVVRVVDPSDGRQVEQLEIGGEGIVTNCCFGGTDGRTLFATDSIPGRVVAWDGLPHPGLALTPWTPPTRTPPRP